MARKILFLVNLTILTLVTNFFYAKQKYGLSDRNKNITRFHDSMITDYCLQGPSSV